MKKFIKISLLVVSLFSIISISLFSKPLFVKAATLPLDEIKITSGIYWSSNGFILAYNNADMETFINNGYGYYENNVNNAFIYYYSTSSDYLARSTSGELVGILPNQQSFMNLLGISQLYSVDLQFTFINLSIYHDKVNAWTFTDTINIGRSSSAVQNVVSKTYFNDFNLIRDEILDQYNNTLYTTGYDAGVTSGYDSGYAVGLLDGEPNGYTKGYDAGKLDGINLTNDQVYQDGYDDGMRKGFGNDFSKWIVPAIIIVLIGGGLITIARKKSEQ